jgi:hypothetical protein
LNGPLPEGTGGCQAVLYSKQITPIKKHQKLIQIKPNPEQRLQLILKDTLPDETRDDILAGGFRAMVELHPG